MKAANEVARFLLELCALAAFAFVAMQVVDGPVRFVLAVVAVLVAAALWGVLVAPNAKRRLADPVRLVVEIAFFAAAGVGLIAVGARWLGIAMGVLGIANAVSLRFHDPVLGALG